MQETFRKIYGFVRGAWPRRWMAVATAWALALAAWILILLMPNLYEASARVFVDARTPLRPVLEGIAIQEDYNSQVTLVREALLSRPQLEAVARQTGLDTDVTNQAGMDGLVTALQSQIEVEAETATTPGASASDAVFTISYRHPDRDKSVEVVRALLKNFEEGTLSGNRSGASEAHDFLNVQIADLERRLQEAEQRRAEFQKRNIGLIPGERGDYFTRLTQEMTGLQEAETNLAVATSRRAELQRQLANASAYLPGSAAPVAGAIVGAPPDVTLRRQEAEQRLEELLLRYTERHHDVIALRQTIEELKAREAKELAELQRGGMGTGAIRSLSANPIYQQIQAQLNTVQVEIASYQGAIEQHRREIGRLRAFVDQAPEIEQQFARLNRDYDVTREQYETFVARREQARVTDDAARTGIVRFEVIEPPRAGLDPVSPRRTLLNIAALLLAVGAGIGLAILPRLLVPTFDNPDSLGQALDVPVLGVVSMARSTTQRKRERREIFRVSLAGVALLALAGLLIVAGGAGARVLQDLLA